MTPEREAAIVQLLRTRDEHLPTPTRRSEVSSGFAHGPALMTCEDCLANGKVMYGCEPCGGRGFVAEKRDRDPMAKNETAAYGLDGSRHDLTNARDRQIDALARQTRPASKIDELADANQNPYSWECERERMYRLYDYGALDRGLDQLRLTDDGAYRALHAVFVYGWLAEASATAEAACSRGLRFLAELLPDPLRAPGVPCSVANLSARGRVADPRALAQRDAAIVAALGDASVREVAARFGLSVSQVNRIVAKRSAEAA